MQLHVFGTQADIQHVAGIGTFRTDGTNMQWLGTLSHGHFNVADIPIARLQLAFEKAGHADKVGTKEFTGLA